MRMRGATLLHLCAFAIVALVAAAGTGAARATAYDGLDFSLVLPEPYGMPERSRAGTVQSVAFRSGDAKAKDTVSVVVSVVRTPPGPVPPTPADLALAREAQIKQSTDGLKKRDRSVVVDPAEPTPILRTESLRARFAGTLEGRTISGWVYAVALPGKSIEIRIECPDPSQPVAQAARVAVEKMHFR